MEEHSLIKVGVQLTADQIAWLDARAARHQTYSRAAEMRTVVREAMERERSALAA